MDQIDLTEDRERWRDFVNAVMKLRVPKSAGNFLNGCGLLSVSRRTAAWSEFL
jgi:hypothetical protein